MPNRPTSHSSTPCNTFSHKPFRLWRRSVLLFALCLAVCAALGLWVEVARAQAATATLSGLAYADVNKNNQRDASEAGIAGLAKIARSCAVLAVADAAIAGLDLAALRKLGVKFIAIDADSIYSGYTIASTWQEFAQVARGLHFQIMITDINNPTQAAASAQIARLVTGTYFAPARRVKVNAGASRRSSATVAA